MGQLSKVKVLTIHISIPLFEVITELVQPMSSSRLIGDCSESSKQLNEINAPVSKYYRKSLYIYIYLYICSKLVYIFESIS